MPTKVTPQAPLFLAGPTAVGKSEVAMLLAERLDGEIISVDSMQVYRGLDIGTAKPSAADCARVLHHLLDVVELIEPFDAAKFAVLAHAAIRQIQERGRIPILCGGTGLYFKALLDGLGKAPPADPALRAELEAAPLADLLRELAGRDRATFERIDRQNPRRVIRALEVIRLTGKPFSEQRAHWLVGEASHTTHLAPRFFALSRSGEDLLRRIDARVDRMFASGLVAETRALLRHGLEQNKTAMQAIGYRQVVEHLRGERPLGETITLVKTRTRQFAKRQMTWFRRQLPVTWVAIRPEEQMQEVAARVESELKAVGRSVNQ
jgi:tRNA dimethylallyltransferase